MEFRERQVEVSGRNLSHRAPRRLSRGHSVKGKFSLKGSEECDEVLLLVAGQLRAEDQVEELDGVVQRQQTAIMHVWRGVLDAAQRERLIGPSPVSHRPLIIAALKKRSILRSCIRLSV